MSSRFRAPEGGRIPSVTAEVIAVLPAGEFVDEWWAARDLGDISVQVSAPPRKESRSAPTKPEKPVTPAPGFLLVLLAGTTAVTIVRRVTTASSAARLFQHA
jgi:hypothetical protein